MLGDELEVTSHLTEFNNFLSTFCWHIYINKKLFAVLLLWPFKQTVVGRSYNGLRPSSYTTSRFCGISSQYTGIIVPRTLGVKEDCPAYPTFCPIFFQTVSFPRIYLYSFPGCQLSIKGTLILQSFARTLTCFNHHVENVLYADGNIIHPSFGTILHGTAIIIMVIQETPHIDTGLQTWRFCSGKLPFIVIYATSEDFLPLLHDFPTVIQIRYTQSYESLSCDLVSLIYSTFWNDCSSPRWRCRYTNHYFCDHFDCSGQANQKSLSTRPTS